MSVTPRPALEPRRAAWLVCRRYVRRKPINWKETETRRFQQKEKREPVGRESMTISPIESGEKGACTVVSQYGGTASAWAEAYEGGASCLASSGTRYESSPSCTLTGAVGLAVTLANTPSLFVPPPIGPVGRSGVRPILFKTLDGNTAEAAR